MKHSSRLTASIYCIMLSQCGVHAWGPIFEPMKGGWGRVRTVLHVLHREYDEDDTDHDDNSWQAPLPYAASHPEKLVLSPEALIFHNPLLWEPDDDDDDDNDEHDNDDHILEDQTFGMLGDCGDECDLSCDIPDDFQHVDESTLSLVVDFLGIQKAKPIQVPQATIVDERAQGEWE